MLFIICSKNVMNIAFLSNKKKKKIYSDLKNGDIVKILWYFVVFLGFFFNIIKLGEPKFTISHTKSILIFSLLEAAHGLHMQPMLVLYKSVNVHTVICIVHLLCSTFTVYQTFVCLAHVNKIFFTIIWQYAPFIGLFFHSKMGLLVLF